MIGTARVRCELAPGSHPGKPALSVRIVKIIQPFICIIPDYDGYVRMPKEGELITYGPPGPFCFLSRAPPFLLKILFVLVN